MAGEGELRTVRSGSKVGHASRFMLKAETWTVASALFGWIMHQCEERLSSGNVMEAATGMAVSGDGADLVCRMRPANAALLVLIRRERQPEELVQSAWRWRSRVMNAGQLVCSAP